MCRITLLSHDDKAPNITTTMFRRAFSWSSGVPEPAPQIEIEQAEITRLFFSPPSALRHGSPAPYNYGFSFA
jgi:hypothetical protein